MLSILKRQQNLMIMVKFLNKIKLSALGGKEQLKTHFSILHKAVKLFKNNESPISY